jgi:hypothetical protein
MAGLDSGSLLAVDRSTAMVTTQSSETSSRSLQAR